MPYRSRKSIQSSPPLLRTRWTHPQSDTACPTCWRVSSPQVWVRVVGVVTGMLCTKVGFVCAIANVQATNVITLFVFFHFICKCAYFQQSMIQFTDEYFMHVALKEAEKAYKVREVPVGAVVVHEHRIIARAHNQVELLQDATAHAEMIALTAAFGYMGAKYLPDCTLYITLEPCCMCAGALYWAQLGRLVFGAHDPSRGYLAVERNLLHPRTEVTQGVCGEEASGLLTQFFQQLRVDSKAVDT